VPARQPLAPRERRAGSQWLQVPPSWRARRRARLLLFGGAPNGPRRSFGNTAHGAPPARVVAPPRASAASRRADVRRARPSLVCSLRRADTETRRRPVSRLQGDCAVRGMVEVTAARSARNAPLPEPTVRAVARAPLERLGFSSELPSQSQVTATLYAVASRPSGRWRSVTFGRRSRRENRRCRSVGCQRHHVRVVWSRDSDVCSVDALPPREGAETDRDGPLRADRDCTSLVAFRGDRGSCTGASACGLRAALVTAFHWRLIEQMLGCQACRSATGERPASRDPSCGMDRRSATASVACHCTVSSDTAGASLPPGFEVSTSCRVP
jgi:hypothetical protein